MGRIALHDISKSYGAVKVLKGIDLTVEEGELVVFVGPVGLRQVHVAANDLRS